MLVADRLEAVDVDERQAQRRAGGAGAVQVLGGDERGGAGAHAGQRVDGAGAGVGGAAEDAEPADVAQQQA